MEEMRSPQFKKVLAFGVLVLLQSQPGWAEGKRSLESFAADALTEAFRELKTGAAEKKIFDKEALGETQAFVSNYRSKGETTDVQIDKEKLKNYLRFQAAQYSNIQGGDSGASVCMAVRTQPGCEACAQLESELAGVIEARLERRGFQARLGPTLSKESGLRGDEAFDDLVVRSNSMACDGLLYGELSVDKSADESHDDQQLPLRWNVYLSIKDRSGRRVKGKGTSVAQVSKGQMSPAAIKSHVHGLTSRSVPDLYASVAAGSSQGSGISGATAAALNEVDKFIRLEQVSSYAVYQKFKQVVSSHLPELKLEERIMSQGVVQFEVAPSASMSQVASKLKTLPWSQGGGASSLEVLGSTAEELTVVLK